METCWLCGGRFRFEDGAHAHVISGAKGETLGHLIVDARTGRETIRLARARPQFDQRYQRGHRYHGLGQPAENGEHDVIAHADLRALSSIRTSAVGAEAGRRSMTSQE